jgi:hypothetical protein
MKNEKKLPDTDPQNTSIMPGPYPPPPPPEEHMVAFKFWVGEQVRVRNIDVIGIIVALAVNQTEGKICLVDNGSREKWYAEDLLDYPYVYFGGDEKPSVPPPVVHD